MIKKFLKRVFRRSAKAKTVGNAQVIPFALHGVSREQISYGAKRVTDGLQAAGFQVERRQGHGHKRHMTAGWLDIR